MISIALFCSQAKPISISATAASRSVQCIHQKMFIHSHSQPLYPLSATLLCLGKLVYEYHTYLNETVIDQVLEIVTALMQSKQREVLKGVLSFLKVCRIL